MRTTVTSYEFRDEMIKHGFSYEGAIALFDYLEEVDEDLEFDPTAFRCEFTEYANLKEFHSDYGRDYGLCLEELELHTTVIKIDDHKFIVQDF
jgi:hypothetical protein|tara:strand:+ start:439 stop:717 length:279 start_codon:yes stop_codon:yes gene_type:complete